MRLGFGRALALVPRRRRRPLGLDLGVFVHPRGIVTTARVELAGGVHRFVTEKDHGSWQGLATSWFFGMFGAEYPK